MRREGERGETLIELLITIAIMGIAVISVVAAIAVASNSSDEHSKQVGVVVVLRNYAEAVMNATYQPCAAPTGIAYSPPNGYIVNVTGVASYDGTSSSPAAFNTCPATDKGAVRISLEAHSTDNRASRTMEIVKAADYVRPT
jgi:type II secretory pathway pseudopilin PulG